MLDDFRKRVEKRGCKIIGYVWFLKGVFYDKNWFFVNDFELKKGLRDEIG